MCSRVLNLPVCIWWGSSWPMLYTIREPTRITDFLSSWWIKLATNNNAEINSTYWNLTLWVPKIWVILSPYTIFQKLILGQQIFTHSLIILSYFQLLLLTVFHLYVSCIITWQSVCVPLCSRTPVWTRTDRTAHCQGSWACGWDTGWSETKQTHNYFNQEHKHNRQ